MLKSIIIALLMLTSLNLMACGQAGPLYLPQMPNQPTQQEPKT